MTNSQKPPILVPRLAPPFDQVQRFFLEQALEDGRKDKLEAIIANFQRKYICGLTFVYKSGVVRLIGDGTTTHRKEARFADGDRIVGFLRAIGGAERGITQLEVCQFLSPSFLPLWSPLSLVDRERIY